MGSKFYAVDSGGTTRLTRKFFAVDAGGTTRQIKKGFVIDGGGVARLFYQNADVLSLVAGQATNIQGQVTFIGFTANSVGSLSPTTLGDGHGVTLLGDHPQTTTRSISVTGFASNPGIGYLQSLTLNGLTLLGASATYSYANPTASWVWTISAPQEIANGGNYTVQIVRG